MTNPALSLIIVSQKRPLDLERILSCLPFQSLQNFEIIVVADRPPLISKLLQNPLTFIEMTEGNISRARNLGIMAAKAPIIAFCDDDALPDPPWLEKLITPFYQNRQIGAAVGYTRGRNGVSYQWKAIGFYANAADFRLNLVSHETRIIQNHPHFYIKCIGTNCAFRRDILHAVGGFDEALHYYLDDTEISKRLQDRGIGVAIVPQAQVIHNFRPSRWRNTERIPQSLYNLGASSMVYLETHCPDEKELNLDRLRAAQADRLIRFFNLGLISPKDIKSLSRDLEMGIIAGARRGNRLPLEPIEKLPLAPLIKKARAIKISRLRPDVKDNEGIYVQKRLIPTNHAARVAFSRGGYWRIRMGWVGRFERSEPIVKIRSPKKFHQKIDNWFKDKFTNPTP